MEEIRNKATVLGSKIPQYTDEFKKKVAEEVVAGKLTKSEARKVYGIGGQSVILAWIKKYNLDPNYIAPKHSSEEFKRKVAEEVAAGKLTKSGARKVYGIGGRSVILAWIKKYNLEPNYISPNKPNIAESPMPKEEDISKDRKIAELEKELETERNKAILDKKALETARNKAIIDEKALETARNKAIIDEKVIETERNKSRLFEIIIEIAEKDYGIAIKKKPKAKQFGSLNQKKGKK